MSEINIYDVEKEQQKYLKLKNMEKKPKAWWINRQIAKRNFIRICLIWKIFVKEENGKKVWNNACLLYMFGKKKP